MALPLVIDPCPAHTEALYKALGKGLIRWQNLETALYLVAFAFMGTDHEICSRIFFYIKSAESKLALTDRLVSHKLDQRTRIKFWVQIVSDTRAAIDFRNRLAHFKIFYLDPNEISKIKKPSAYHVAISYHHLDEHARRGGNVRYLSVEDIEHNTDELRFLAYTIIYFLIDRVPQLERFEERLPQDLRQWLDSFRKTTRPPEFPPPRGSSRK